MDIRNNIYYKLTDQDMQTKNGFQWELGKQYEIAKDLQSPNRQLCTSSWFHVYNHPLLAILLNPMHAGIKNPRLFECECTGYCKLDRGLKIGFTKVKLVKEIEVPNIILTQKIAFGILCAKRVYSGPKWNEWADNWLENKDRCKHAAAAAAYTVAKTINSNIYTINAAYGHGGIYAINAAIYANDAAYGHDDVVDGDVYAYNTATSAVNAANSDINLNLVSLAQEAMKY